MERERIVERLRGELLSWYRRERRRLPWREQPDGYRVWVSEVMLQQTRVAAVLEHYRRFLERFPTATALALSSEDEVLAAWSGLGYYRRARLLRRGAIQVEQMGGVLPRSAAHLRLLAGVGRYTAAAIASIAYGEAVAVVDGNVERVLGRLDGRSRSASQLWKRAEELLDRRHPGEWNQAMMELGAMVCLPRNPLCPPCPLRPWCLAPGAQSSRPRPARQRVRMARALVRWRGRVYLVRRADWESKMAGMWELPACSAPGEPLLRVRHSITDTDYEVRILPLALGDLKADERRGGRWVSASELEGLALTGLTRKALARLARESKAL